MCRLIVFRGILLTFIKIDGRSVHYSYCGNIRSIFIHLLNSVISGSSSLRLLIQYYNSFSLIFLTDTCLSFSEEQSECLKPRERFLLSICWENLIKCEQFMFQHVPLNSIWAIHWTLKYTRDRTVHLLKKNKNKIPFYRKS